MQIYNVGFRAIAPSTGVPLITLFTNAAGSSTTSTGRSLLILEIDIEGAANSSNYTELGLYRLLAPTGAASSTFTASTTSIPQNVDQLTGTGGTAASLSPAAQCTVTNGAFAAGSTFPGGFSGVSAFNTNSPLHVIGLNVNGQRYFWRANPNLSNAIVVPGTGVVSTSQYSGAISLVSIAAGTSPNVSGRIQFAEL